MKSKNQGGLQPLYQLAHALALVSMDPQELETIINKAIRQHELRVALISGILGAALLAGTWHAIWLCRR